MFLRSVLCSADAGANAGGAGPLPAVTEAGPAQPPTPAVEATPEKPRSKNEARRNSMDAVREWAASRGKPAATPAAAVAASASAAAPASTEVAQEAAAQLERAGQDVPEQRENESDQKYEQRLLKLMQQTRTLEAEGRRLTAESAKERAAREVAEKKAGELERKLTRAKNPDEVLDALEELTGMTYEQLTKAIVEGKVRPGRGRSQLPPEEQARIDGMAAELEKLRVANERAEQQRQQQEQQQEQQQTFVRHIDQATAYLRENEEQFPLLAASSWAPADLVRAAYQRNTRDIVSIAREYEAKLNENLQALLGNEKARKRLKLDAPKPANTNAPAQAKPAAAPVTPAAVSRVSTEAATPPARPQTSSERRARGLEALRAFNANKR